MTLSPYSLCEIRASPFFVLKREYANLQIFDGQQDGRLSSFFIWLVLSISCPLSLSLSLWPDLMRRLETNLMPQWFATLIWSSSSPSLRFWGHNNSVTIDRFSCSMATIKYQLTDWQFGHRLLVKWLVCWRKI